MSEESENIKDKPFKPTPHMIVWLNTTIKSGSHNIDEIARLSGINESSYYRWLKMPEFVEWFNKKWEKSLLTQSWKLDSIGMKNAEKDIKYWEAMQDRIRTIAYAENAEDMKKYIK